MLPEARILKRFLAPLLVFILGIYMLLYDMPSGVSRRENLFYPTPLVKTIRELLRNLLFRTDDHDHLPTFHLGHLFDNPN